MLNIVKITTSLNPFDLIAPHSCRGCNKLGKPLCDCCKNYIINSHLNYCPNCKTKNPSGDCPNCKSLPLTYIVTERTTLIGKLIHDLKYTSVRSLAKPLAEILDSILPCFDNPVSLIPLPTASNHIRSRGFDHTLAIAKNLAKSHKNNYKIEKILVRAKNTVQVGSDEKTRKIQADSAYKITDLKNINPNTTYLLFDDVWTTGSSMKAALKKLREAGAQKVIIAVLAVNRLD